MKVAHLIVDLDMGGAEMMLLKLVEHMSRERFENIVISMVDEGALVSRFKALGLPIYTLSMGYGRPTLSGLKRLASLLQQEKPDVLQTWMYHANLLGLIAAKLAGVRKVAWNIRASRLDNGSSRLGNVMIWLGAWLSSGPDLVLFNSQAGLTYHHRIGYRPRRTVVIPNGFDLDRFRPDADARLWLRRELGLNQNAVLIGMVARFDSNKDHTTFLQAACRFAGQRSDVHFVLVGRNVTSDNPTLSEQIASLRLQNCVHLIGERADVPRITAALDVFTLSSVYEGFANVIGEGMACGIPAVVTDTGDAALIVGDAGIIVPPHDPQALAEGWSKILAMPDEEHRIMGLKGRQRIAEKFSISKIVERYEQVYQSLAGSK